MQIDPNKIEVILNIKKITNWKETKKESKNKI